MKGLQPVSYRKPTCDSLLAAYNWDVNSLVNTLWRWHEAQTSRNLHEGQHFGPASRNAGTGTQGLCGTKKLDTTPGLRLAREAAGGQRLRIRAIH